MAALKIVERLASYQGTPTCAGSGQQHSGQSALQFTATNQQYALQQETARDWRDGL